MTKGSDNEFPSVLFGELGSAPTTPASGKWRVYTKADGLYIVDDAGASTGPFGVGGSGGLDASGWEAAAAMTYDGADDPTYTATISGDVSGVYSVGMKMRVTQSTGGTKYFIITKIAVSGDTTLTLYGGTDYNLEDEAISDPYYSVVRAPYGFPLDPAGWSVVVTDTTQRTQASPTQNVWYNLGTTACQISVPVGVWNLGYKVYANPYMPASLSVDELVTLSTANNSESDTEFTGVTRINGASATLILGTSIAINKFVAATTKTTYYLNAKTTVVSIANITFENGVVTMAIRAVCAYL